MPEPKKPLLGGTDDTNPADEGDEAAKAEAEAKAKAEQEAQAKEEADAKAKEEADAKAKAEAEAKAKEEADYKIELPEGAVVDEGVMEEFTAWAKAKGLTKAVAQDLVDFQLGLAKKSADRFEAERKKWVQTTKDDPQYGQAQFEKNLSLARKAMKAFSTPALNQLLDATGFGDHPEVFKLMVNIGRRMGEADVIDARNVDPKPKDAATLLFGDMGAGKKK